LRSEEKRRNSSNDNRSNEGLELKIQKPRLTGANNDPWLEFDIIATETAGNNIYFDNCLIRIEYNASAFGSNIVANNNVIITRATNFNTTTYTNPQTNSIDQTTNSIGIPLGLDINTTTYNRVFISAIPQEMLHIKIKIQNCSELTGINYDDVDFTDIFSFFTENPDDPVTAGTSFTTTDYVGFINDNTCEPIISSFTDDVPAGTGALMTISGRYFGSYKGVGTVIFKNANRGHQYPVPTLNISQTVGEGIESYDIVSWSNDEIILTMPAVIDSITTNSLDYHYHPVPGSGKFKVKNRFNHYKESPTEITIPYAVNQATDLNSNFQFTKVTPQLAGVNGDGGYTIHLNHNVVSTYPNAKLVIQKALRDWSCVSGVNWELGRDTSLVAASDSICVISLNSSMTAVQSTDPNLTYCVNFGRPYLLSFDIEINSSYNWQFDTLSGNISPGYFDFYFAMAHELGHGHLLFHSNDSLNDLMFFNTVSTGLTYSQRKRVWSDPNAMNCSQYIMSNLTGSIMGCNFPEQHTLNYPTNCTGLSISENSNEINITTYPNPINSGDLTIKLDLIEPKENYFLLYNDMGQLIKISEKETAQNIEYTLNVEDLSSGIYYLQIIIDNESQTVKFVKD